MKKKARLLFIAAGLLLTAAASPGAGCRCSTAPQMPLSEEEEASGSGRTVEEGSRGASGDPYEGRREAMVKDQLEARGIKDLAVLAAMRKVPRHEFVPAELRDEAYRDYPLPIGEGQTISQPYIVAFMTEAARLKKGDRVLEIGTGSGYQVAILAEITDQVYSLEILCTLERRARATLDRLGYTQVITKCADGYQGWPEYAPFDAVIVTAAPEHVPQPLLDQLKIGGRLIIPVGERYFQELKRLTKTETGFTEENLLPVLFVPMTGEAQKHE